MLLNEKQKKHLRSLAHSKKPVVIIGAGGLSDNVIAEIDSSLEAHELMKVRVNAEDREARDLLITDICRQTGAVLVQRIGHIAVLYRPAQKPRLVLPKD